MMELRNVRILQPEDRRNDSAPPLWAGCGDNQLGYIPDANASLKADTGIRSLLCLGERTSPTVATRFAPNSRGRVRKNCSILEFAGIPSSGYLMQISQNPHDSKRNLLTQAAILGAFILANARDGSEVAEMMADHLRRYLEVLFHRKDGVAV